MSNQPHKMQTTCNHASPGPPNPASSPAGSSETSHVDSWWNWGVLKLILIGCAWLPYGWAYALPGPPMAAPSHVKFID
jgi:hypothetical protein